MKIVFMGTPEFAIPALSELINSGHEIIGVYTKQPKRVDRGKKIKNTPVHDLALKYNIPVFTPKTFKNGKNLEDLIRLKPDLVTVVAYGLILTKEVLEIPKYGCINIHPSLLPRWRGCAPIERCLMSDDTETGVCIIKVDEGLDSGDIISSYKTKITNETDIVSLKKELSDIGSKMLLDTVNEIEKNNGNIKTIKQSNIGITIADKITNNDAIIDWENDDVIQIHRKIMALNDSVGVHIKHNNNVIKIIKSSYIIDNKTNNIPGTIIDKKFSIVCKNGILKPLILQREGKKAVNINDFVNGYRFDIGEKID